MQTKAHDKTKQNKTPIPPDSLSISTKIKEYILILLQNIIAFWVILSKKAAKLQTWSNDLWSYNLSKQISDTAKRPAHIPSRDYALLAMQTVIKSTVKLFIFLDPFVVCRPTPL